MRPGKPDPNRTRTIKMKLKAKNEKGCIIARLSNPKNAEDRLKRINIIEDYTVEERQEIRKWVAKANEKNFQENGNVIWKVRGRPKNDNLINDTNASEVSSNVSLNNPKIVNELASKEGLKFF